ncbi:MAG: DUF4278 domain-containing protein [Microcoleaceae cyanobacterium]
MELTYRGRSYEKNFSSLEIMPGEVAGKYRGNEWTYQYPRHIPMPPPTTQLKYRGVDYNSGQVVEQSSCIKQSEKVLNKVELAIKNSQTDPGVNQIHQANICRNLDRRWLIAQAEGNEDLMRLLEKEFQQVAC